MKPRNTIREAIDTALRTARQSLQRHPVDVEVPENLPEIKMDVERISEVLVHLLENAGKYAPPDTPIHLMVEGRLDGQIVISVADQPEYLRVFVGRLRKKLEPDETVPRYIVTELWVGYRFEPGD